ncbi:MAG: hypothetical protein L6Q92_16700, partial [Phycisphaerae bacterium]|nr:hypothetical protein [Phycisphaerae bacterium]
RQGREALGIRLRRFVQRDTTSQPSDYRLRIFEELHMANVTYDEGILQKVVNDLYRQASAIVALAMLLGAFVGTGIGQFSFPKDLGDSSVRSGIGLLLGLLIGYFGGQSRAFSLRAQAQTLLLQMQIERNTLIAATEAKSKRELQSATVED